MNLSRLAAYGLFCVMALAPLRGQDPAPSGGAVFTVVFEAKASANNGTSASSHVEVQLAPGLE